MELLLMLLLLMLPLLLWWLTWRRAGRKGIDGLWPSVLVLLTVALTYAQLGAYEQYSQAYVDPNIDLQLSGRIRELQRQLAQTPDDLELMAQLVACYSQGGWYTEAVLVQQQLIQLHGRTAAALAQLAELQYYRDQRQLSDDTRQLIGIVLQLQADQPQARMLLANALLSQQQYAAAIAQWQWLLQQPSAAEYQQPLQRAIHYAQSQWLAANAVAALDKPQ